MLAIWAGHPIPVPRAGDAHSIVPLDLLSSLRKVQLEATPYHDTRRSALARAWMRRIRRSQKSWWISSSSPQPARSQDSGQKLVFLCILRSLPAPLIQHLPCVNCAPPPPRTIELSRTEYRIRSASLRLVSPRLHINLTQAPMKTVRERSVTTGRTEE